MAEREAAMPARRIDLGSNLYLFASERPTAAGCIVMASYVGNQSCQGFRVPARVTVSFLPPHEQKKYRRKVERGSRPYRRHRNRVDLVVGALLTDSSPKVSHSGNESSADSMLCKYTFAHQAGYAKNDEG